MIAEVNKLNIKLITTGIIFLFFISSYTAADIINSKNSVYQSTSGTIFYVGGNGPGNYTNIQDAVDNTSEGDTVFVFNGTYIGYVIINKSIDLIGEDKNTTIIIGYFAFTISIVSDWVNMSGFYIQNNARLGEGIRIDSSNSCFKNNIVDTPDDNIRINGNGNIIFGNNITSDSMYIYGNSNIVFNNTISNDVNGILLTYSSNNIISNNSFFNSGILLSEENVCYNNIKNNIVNNKPLVYLYNESNMLLNVYAGQIILVNCTNITIQNQEISNTNVAIQIWGSNNCVISRNTLADNHFGIYINSWNNIINYNTFTNNYYGIWLLTSSQGNFIYHNNFMNNDENAYDESSNIWDDGYPSGGNYWNDYNGTDSNGDGIGDSPYLIPVGDNQDNYPFMSPDGWMNQPPSAPTIDGPNSGKPGIEYTYCINLSDPDNDTIYVLWDWGDGISSGWLGPYSSGSEVCDSHSWNKKGTYIISVTIKDIYGATVTANKEVNIPRNKAIFDTNPILLLLIKQFPILKNLLGL